MDGEPLIYREEVTAVMISLADINVTLKDILELLEEIHGEDQEEEP